MAKLLSEEFWTKPISELFGVKERLQARYTPPKPTALTVQEAKQIEIPGYGVLTLEDALDYKKRTEDLKLGISSVVGQHITNAIATAKWKTFLAENGCTIYDKVQVHRYLQRRCPNNYAPCWINAGSGAATRPWSMLSNGSVLENPYAMSMTYTKVIPIEVLEILAKLRADLSVRSDKYSLQPFNVYVSDFVQTEAIDGKFDPFLAVGNIGTNHANPDNVWFIIERWDEPAFRMR